MNSINLYALVCVCLAIALAQAAPTTVAPAGQETPTTTLSSSTLSSTPAAELASSAPATDDSAHTPNTTTSMAVSTTHDSFNASSFTCYGRLIGYYADPEHDCKVYHFCLLGDYNGEAVYQRISYLCLNGTVFDQQALDCVDAAKITAPCKESFNHYDTSNAILREAIVGNQVHEQQGSTSPSAPAPTPELPATSDAAPAKTEAKEPASTTAPAS